MSRIYTSAADHVNNHPYLVLVSSNYNPIMPQPYLTGELEPIYNNPTPNHPVRANLPLKNLIDLHSTQQSFQVIHDLDVIKIFHSIDAYLLEIKDSIAINPSVRLYVEKVLLLRANAFTNFARMLNRHPEWKAAYAQGSEPLLQLLELFSAPNTIRRKLLDPIEQLRDPPVRLPDINSNSTGTKSNQLSNNTPMPYHYA